jgi:hypothetical protein
MDAEIRPSLPQGSPFLAYGLAPNPFSGRRLFVLIGGIILGVLVSSMLFLAFLRIPYPAGTSLFATLGSEQRYGYALEKNHVSQFDLTLFGKMNHPERARAGLVKLSSEKEIEITNIRLLDLIPFFVARITGKGYAIARLEDGTIVGGSIEGNTWKTNAPIETSSLELPSTDLAIDLVAFPDAWSDLAIALEAYGLVMQKVAPPDVFGFSPTTGTIPEIQFGYEDGVPPSSKVAIAAFAGLADRRLTQLPDGELVEELFLPEGLLADASSTAAAASGTGFLITDQTVGVRSDTPRGQAEATCGNRTVFHMSGIPLETVRSEWKLPLHSGITVLAGQEEGRLVVCFAQD